MGYVGGFGIRILKSGGNLRIILLEANIARLTNLLRRMVKIKIYEVEVSMIGESQKTALIGGVEKREIVIVDYDGSWPQKYEEHAKAIRNVLLDRLLMIEHVGSTSVPGLAAKPIIDIDVIVADSSDEAAYLPLLEAAGYELRVREPDWHEHRMMRTPGLDVPYPYFFTGLP